MSNRVSESLGNRITIARDRLLPRIGMGGGRW